MVVLSFPQPYLWRSGGSSNNPPSLFLRHRTLPVAQRKDSLATEQDTVVLDSIDSNFVNSNPLLLLRIGDAPPSGMTWSTNRNKVPVKHSDTDSLRAWPLIILPNYHSVRAF